MNYDGYFFLGTIQRTYQTNGLVIASFDADDTSPYIKLDWLFIEENHVLVPYEIKNIKKYSNSFIIDLVDVTTIEKAETLVKKSIYLPIDKLPSLTGKQFYYHEVIGFTAVDNAIGELGTIEELVEYPGQTLAKLYLNKKEVLLPLILNWITKIDREQKKLFYNLPEGYLDVYTAEDSSD